MGRHPIVVIDGTRGLPDKYLQRLKTTYSMNHPQCNVDVVTICPFDGDLRWKSSRIEKDEEGILDGDMLIIEGNDLCYGCQEFRFKHPEVFQMLAGMLAHQRRLADV